jgi:hypothetical protein
MQFICQIYLTNAAIVSATDSAVTPWVGVPFALKIDFSDSQALHKLVKRYTIQNPLHHVHS